MESKFLRAKKVMLFVIPIVMLMQVALVFIVPNDVFLVAVPLITWLVTVVTATLLWHSPGQLRSSLAAFAASAGALCVAELHLVEHMDQTTLIVLGSMISAILLGSVITHRVRQSATSLLVVYYASVMLLTAVNFMMYHNWLLATISGVFTAVFVVVVIRKT